MPRSRIQPAKSSGPMRFGIVEEEVIRPDDANRRVLHGDSIVWLVVPEGKRRRAHLLVRVSLVLDDEHPTLFRVVEEPPRGLSQAVANQERVRPDHDRVEGIERCMSQVLIGQFLHRKPETAKESRHLVADAGDVGVCMSLVDVHVDQVDLHDRGLHDELPADARALVRLAAQARCGLHDGRDRRFVEAAGAADAVSNLVRPGRRVRCDRHADGDAVRVAGLAERHLGASGLHGPAVGNLDLDHAGDRGLLLVSEDTDTERQGLRHALGAQDVPVRARLDRDRRQDRRLELAVSPGEELRVQGRAGQLQGVARRRGACR